MKYGDTVYWHHRQFGAYAIVRRFCPPGHLLHDDQYVIQDEHGYQFIVNDRDLIRQ